MVIGSKKNSKNLKSRISLKTININNYEIELLHSVRDLGIFLDDNLTLQFQIKSVVKSCNHQIRNLYHVKKYITENCLKMLVVNQVLCRIDYCNSI